MINNPIIIGCGTVGASLALKLAQERLVPTLKIFDFDTVGEKPTYPFNVRENGISKIQIIKFCCQKYNPNIEIETYDKRVTSPLSIDGFVIDCRDSKATNINSEIKISLDGPILYIDSIKTKHSNKNYHHYISPRNEFYIKKAIEVIFDYLKHGEYIFKDLKLYNLENNDSYVITRENEYVCEGERDFKS